MDEEEINKKCIAIWGENEQIRQTIEECAELIVQLAKYGRNINSSTGVQICDEIADVEIMCQQMRLIFDPLNVAVDKIKDIKLLSLERRLENESM